MLPRISSNLYERRTAAVVAKWPRPAGAWAALANHMGAPISSEMTLAISGRRLVYSATTGNQGTTSASDQPLWRPPQPTLVEELSAVLGGGPRERVKGSLGGSDGSLCDRRAGDRVSDGACAAARSTHVDIGLGAKRDASDWLLGRGVNHVVGCGIRSERARNGRMRGAGGSARAPGKRPRQRRTLDLSDGVDPLAVAGDARASARKRRRACGNRHVELFGRCGDASRRAEAMADGR